jgi:hypothetical protein
MRASSQPLTEALGPTCSRVTGMPGPQARSTLTEPVNAVEFWWIYGFGPITASPPVCRFHFRQAIRAKPLSYPLFRELHRDRMAGAGSNGRGGGWLGSSNSLPPPPPVFRLEAEWRKWNRSEGAEVERVPVGQTGG